MSFPQYAVSKWIGHSITVSGKHYANAVPDELFDRAAGTRSRGQGHASICAQRQAQQKASETPRNEKKSDSAEEDADAPNSGPFRGLRELSTSRVQSRKWSRGESNPRAAAVRSAPLRV